MVARTPPGPAPGRPRIALMTVLLAAAMPVRLSGSFPLINSISILDILLIIAGATLFLDLAFRPVDVGDRALFGLLCAPLLVSTVSLVWSHDRAATMRAVIIYTEALIAYLFVLRELGGLPPDRVVRFVKRYAYLLIIPGILLLLHVPGFAPDVAAKHSSGGYLTYYTRLSHPVLGGSNNLATVLAFFAPVLLYWGHTRHDRGITVAGFVTLLAIFLTLSRGVLLSFLIAGVLYGVLAAGRRTTRQPGLAGKIAAAVAAGAVAIAVFYAVNPATHEFFSGRFSASNVTSRSELASVSFTKIASSPVLGYGSGVNLPVNPLVNGNRGVAELGKLDTHNAYLQQALYFGLPLGLVVSLALWGTAGLFLARRRSAAVAGVIAYTLLVQLVSFLFESSFEGTVLRVLFYLSIGLAVGLLRAVEEERRVSPERQPPVPDGRSHVGHPFSSPRTASPQLRI
jgi:O-antigen ligase